ncbi:hypothetical protein vBKpnAMK4_00480 [Klebsiella phage vB_Kpn_AM_K4]
MYVPPRDGNPVSRVVIYQSKTTSYVLGYDKIFYGRKSSDVRWSSNEVKFSDNEVTFAKLGDQLKLGFEVELFGTYASLPADVTKYAEAFTCNDDYLYVVAKDTVRKGNPVSRVVIYQSSTTSYVLGYDKIFYGRKSSDVRWSSNEVKFSDNEVTFAKLGDQLKLGFEVELFGTYASLPADVTKYAEAFTCNDDHLYVVAKDTVRRVKLKDAELN